MSERQRNLFDTVGGQGAYYQPRDARPLAATADPATSHEAAGRVKAKADDQVTQCAAWVARYPGRTAQELASVCGDRDLDRFVFGRRLSVAESRGLVKRCKPGEERQCNVTGYKAATWSPVERG